ncbi:ATP-binding protein [Mycolicibacterium moriokaense]|uniref:Adenylate/guanylate cyclase n=1 Tax=Mycolicibacterium moriokaense TaxID=39691 RepID=A0A318HPV2_9MYCO|nr:adenylate/guanylate cyclase domain-containing protein [Mycolicibacterium moriokaense]PXX06312.1 adenylate/guanylate cyclase [Mycolicibacterium moriokaense]
MSDPKPAPDSGVASDAMRGIDELLDRAVNALNSGDRATADALAEQVLAVDRTNQDAEEVLSAPTGGGEIRRLTMLFADLVDSTKLSIHIDPEIYRTVVVRYREQVRHIVDRYEGHIGSTKGDGLLAIFGHPKAHENDVRRAVLAALDIALDVGSLSERVRSRFGFEISVRVGVHRGFVYLDTASGDVYGSGANLAERTCSLAEPGTIVVSAAIERLVHDVFELQPQQPQKVKGVDAPFVHYRVVAERDTTQSTRRTLVGRKRELAYLRESWAEAAAGALASRGIVFVGEGGIGKTRLAYAAVDLAQQADAVVLGLFGSPFHTDVGLRPVRRMLERRCGIRRDSDATERLAKLEAEIRARSLDPAAVVPLLAPVLGIGEESGYEPARASGVKLYEQIAEGIRRYLLACLGTGPALVLVEDMHWFDEDTVEVVNALLHEDLRSLLVVITARQLPALSATTRTFELAPLSDAEADKLILGLHPQMQPDARTAVKSRCDGIPLYIEEVVAKLKDQPADAAGSEEVPDTLYETLFARLRSSEHALLVVEAAALIGSRVDQRLLSSVVDLDSREIENVIGELTRGRVLTPLGENSWRFHHELLREVAAELSPPSVRRRLHSRIADALVAAAAGGTPEWPLVSHHYEQAERFDEAASAHERACADARRRGALNEARTYLIRALENLDHLTPGPRRDRREIAVRLESGFLATAAQGHTSSEAAAQFERCLELIGAAPSRELYMTLNALWSYYTARGDFRRATQLLESLRKRGGGAADINRAASVPLIGVLTTLRGEIHTARETLEAAAVAFTDTGAPEMNSWYAPNDPFAAMYSFLGVTRFLQGDLSGAEAALAQMQARCDKLGFPHGAFSLCYGRSIGAWIHAEAGQHERAAEVADELMALGQRYGFDEWMMVAWSEQSAAHAVGALAAGEIGPAALAPHIETMSAVVQTWREYDVKTFLAFYDNVLARLLIAAGDHEAARERVDIALAMAEDTWMKFYDADLLRLRAHTLEDHDARHAQLCAAIELGRDQGALLFELRSAADDFELMGEQSRDALTDAIGRCPAKQTWPELARARALLG